MPHTYIGAVAKDYPAYLQVPPDGDPYTLTGHPNADPVEIRRGGGNENLPEVPGDGLWVSADPPKADTPAADGPGLQVVADSNDGAPAETADQEPKSSPRRKAA